MTRKEERYLFSDIAVIKQIARQNNLMLQDICNVINTYDGEIIIQGLSNLQYDIIMKLVMSWNQEEQQSPI